MDKTPNSPFPGLFQKSGQTVDIEIPIFRLRQTDLQVGAGQMENGVDTGQNFFRQRRIPEVPGQLLKILRKLLMGPLREVQVQPDDFQVLVGQGASQVAPDKSPGPGYQHSDHLANPVFSLRRPPRSPR